MLRKPFFCKEFQRFFGASWSRPGAVLGLDRQHDLGPQSPQNARASQKALRQNWPNRQNWPRGLTQRVPAGSPAVFGGILHHLGTISEPG